jgi:hypothetical protein
MFIVERCRFSNPGGRSFTLASLTIQPQNVQKKFSLSRPGGADE